MVILLLSVIVLAHTASTQLSHAQTNNTALTLPDFNFVAAGDWGCNSNTNKTISSIQSKNPELVLRLGDYSYKNTVRCRLQMIDPIDEKTKIIIGNHETQPLSLLNRYMSHFNLTKQYYSFDYQNVHFIAMSTELPWTEFGTVQICKRGSIKSMS
jgi:phosphodiesterase/alkaline phosphatase D-like protein